MRKKCSRCKKVGVRLLVCDYLSHMAAGHSEKLLALSRRALLRFRPKQLGFKFQNDDPVDAFADDNQLGQLQDERFLRGQLFSQAENFAQK